MRIKSFFQTTRVAVVMLLMILGIVGRATGQGGCQGCPQMIIYIQSTNAASCGECDGSIDLCVVGQGPYSYQWTGPDEFSSEEEDLVNLLEYESLLKEFEKLPKKTQKIFNLFYVEDLTVDEISKVLKIPTGTIKAALSRTRRKIKNNLKV